MEKKRHTGATVIAVINFVFGGLGAIGLLFLVVPMPGFGTELKNLFMREIPTYAAYHYGIEIGLSFLMCAMLIVGGVGLVKMESWGRLLSITYGTIAILACIVTIAYGVIFQLPTIDSGMDEVIANSQEFKMYPRQQKEMMRDMLKPFMKVAIVAGPILSLIYPIIVLWVMLLPSTRQAFQASGVPQQGIRQEDDYGDFQSDRGYDDGYG